MLFGRWQDTAWNRNRPNGLITAHSLMMVVIMKSVTQFRRRMNLRSVNEPQNSKNFLKKKTSPPSFQCSRRLNSNDSVPSNSEKYAVVKAGSQTVRADLRKTVICTSMCSVYRRKATIGIKSVRPSVRMEKLVSHWTDFHEIWYFMIFSKIRRENSSLISIWHK